MGPRPPGATLIVHADHYAGGTTHSVRIPDNMERMVASALRLDARTTGALWSPHARLRAADVILARSRGPVF